MKISTKAVVAALVLYLLTWSLAGLANAQQQNVPPGVDTCAGSFASESSSLPGPLTLWYRRPATNWNEALPIGNGRLGAMIFGGIEGERIQLNEDTLWAGSPYNPNNPEALAALPEVRKLIFAGKYKDAEMLIQQQMMSKPIRQMSYQTVGDLRLSFPKAQTVSDYRRELDLDEAIARVTYKIGTTTFTREMFSSAVAGVIVIRLTADKKGQVSFQTAIQSPQQATVANEKGETLVLSGTNGSEQGISGKLKFQARVRVLANGGSVGSACEASQSLSDPYWLPGRTGANPVRSFPVNSDNCIAVANANSAIILISAATSYRNYHDVSDNEVEKSKTAVEKAAQKSFAALRHDHVADYQKFFRRVSLELGTSEAMGMPTDERIQRFATTNDPQLAALYFQFARYLLISSSRPGTQPANLQGIRNDLMTPPWSSKYTININTEMNYWLAEPTNLSELTDPLVKMVEDISITGAKTAAVQWGARGWVTHHNTDLWRATGPIDAARYGMWPSGGAWLTMHLWEHYEYTQDTVFLNRIYPILKGASQFFLDTLVEEPKHKWLVTNPSMSPENTHPFGTSITAGPTMDAQLIRDLYANTIRAGEILGIDQDFRSILAKTRARLAPNQIGKGGQLQEWLEDWDLEAPEKHHRHVSHLYGAFPSWQINVFDTPDLVNAVKTTLNQRGDEATGWAIAWRLNLWARLRDAERAYKILALLIRPERTYPNMFDAHPPFQIDGNFGGANGIAEMLMQNHMVGNSVEVELLPALPKEFPTGNIKGLRARGGFEIDVEWKNGELTRATVRSLNGNSIRLRFGQVLRELKTRKGQTIVWDGKGL